MNGETKRAGWPPGGCLPGAPTGPYVQDYCIRLPQGTPSLGTRHTEMDGRQRIEDIAIERVVELRIATDGKHVGRESRLGEPSVGG
jgi:hypothetical protein